MVVGLLGNKSPDSNRFTLVSPKSLNDVRLQATLGNQNPTGLPVGAVRSVPLGEQYTYTGEKNLEMTLKALFSEPFGGGYPASEAQRKIADSKTVKEIRAKSQREFKEFLSEIDPLLIEKLKRKIKAVLC